MFRSPVMMSCEFNDTQLFLELWMIDALAFVLAMESVVDTSKVMQAKVSTAAIPALHHSENTYIGRPMRDAYAGRRNSIFRRGICSIDFTNPLQK